MPPTYLWVIEPGTEIITAYQQKPDIFINSIAPEGVFQGTIYAPKFSAFSFSIEQNLKKKKDKDYSWGDL